MHNGSTVSRLNITRPIDGWFGDFPILVVEVAVESARIVREDPIPVGSRGLLRFAWRGEDLELTAEIAENEWVRILEGSAQLQRLIADSSDELLRAQKANAAGDRARNAIGEETLTAVSAGARPEVGFLQFRFTPAGWKCVRALLPDQPEDGFTVSASEPQEQIDLLCATYEAGDEEAKQMTRAIAMASITR